MIKKVAGMEWLSFDAFLSQLEESAALRAAPLRLMVDQIRPISQEGRVEIAFSAPLSTALERCYPPPHPVRRFLHLLDPDAPEHPDPTDARRYLRLQMERKRLPLSYRDLLEALSVFAPYLEDGAFFLRDEEDAHTDLFRIDGGRLQGMRYPCAGICEDDILNLYHHLARLYPHEPQLQEFVSLRHLYIAEDFINLFFTKYPMGFSTQTEITPSLEVGLQIIAKTLYRAQQHTPDAVDIWHLLGRFGIWLNEPSTTEAAFAKAYIIDPLDPWVHADHAFYRWQCGDYQGAWEHHCFFLEEAPDDPLGLLLAGVYCLQRQERTQAIKYWEQLAGCFEELTHDLDRWRDLGRVESIAKLLEVWLDKAPAVLPKEKVAQAIIDALHILQSRIAWEEAPASLRSQMQRWLQQAQRYAPQDAALWVQEARWARKEGQIQRSREILLEALSFAPKHREVLHLLAQVEAELNFYAASIGRLMRLIELSHNQDNYPIDLYKAQLAAILESHAQVLLREGEKAAAEACYDQILETYESSFIPPGLEMPWLHKARFRLEENKKGLALACAHKALAIHPGSVEGNALTAYILTQMERYQEASPYIHRALSHDPDAPFALYAKACLYAMTGRREEALHDLERALRYDPSLSPQAREEGLFRRLHALPRFWQALQAPKPD